MNKNEQEVVLHLERCKRILELILEHFTEDNAKYSKERWGMIRSQIDFWTKEMSKSAVSISFKNEEGKIISSATMADWFFEDPSIPHTVVIHAVPRVHLDRITVTLTL